MPRPRKVVDDPEKAAKMAADRERKNAANAAKRAARGRPPAGQGGRSAPSGSTPRLQLPSSPVGIESAFRFGQLSVWLRVQLGHDFAVDEDEVRAALARHPLAELMVRSDMTVAGLREDYDEWRFSGTASTSG